MSTVQLSVFGSGISIAVFTQDRQIKKMKSTASNGMMLNHQLRNAAFRRPLTG
jgi:hypothetical protein